VGVEVEDVEVVGAVDAGLEVVDDEVGDEEKEVDESNTVVRR
jgi:hypothetical protein